MFGRIKISSLSRRPGRYTTFIAWDDGTESPLFDDYYNLHGWMRENRVVSSEYEGDQYVPLRVRR